MKKKVAWIVCCLLLSCNTVGTMVYASAPQGENEVTADQTESGEQKKGEAEQPEEKQDNVEENGGDNVSKEQILTSFTDFDMAEFKAYQSLTVPIGTALDDLGLPETLKAAIDGVTGDIDIPVKWKCIDDGFGGNTYTPNPENEATVYTFVVELQEGYELDTEIQKKIEENNGTLPWIEVKYEVPESENEKAGGLTPIALPATASNDKLIYSTGSGVNKSFNIKSKSNIITTYDDYGYEVLIGKGTLPASMDKMVRGGNGTVIEKDGFQIQPILGFTADNAYVKVSYRIYNPSSSAKEVNLAIYGDIKIGDDDEAPIGATNTGINMSDGTNQFNLYCKNTYGSTPADKLWFGAYGDRKTPGYIWSNAGEEGMQPTAGSYTKTDGKITGYQGADSAMALSWQNRALAPGATQDFSFLMSVGESVDPPEINMETELDLAYNATEVQVEADVKDAPDRHYQVSYSLDDGEEQILDATIGGTNHGAGAFAIPADGTKQKVTGTIAVPADWAENSVHKLQVWVKNDKYAMSDVKTVYIIKKSGTGGGEVVEAKEYTINFEKGSADASGTAPSPITAYEMTDVILPLNTFTYNGIEFGGWSDGTNIYGAGQAYTMPSNDITLKATWLIYPITIKPVDMTKYVGEALPSGSLEEVYSGDSALQPGDTLASLGTPKYDWGTVNANSPKGTYPIKLTITNQTKPKYVITCTQGTLTVRQDDPSEDDNYRVEGNLGNNGWYKSQIVIKPKGDVYDKLISGASSVDQLTVKDETKDVKVQLKKSSSGRLTSEKSITLKSDTKAPVMGAVTVKAKNNGLLGDIGRTLTFGHFFKETVEVTIPVSDGTSGVEKMEYRLPGGNYQQAELNQSKDQAVFKIPIGTDGTIQVKATDKAGNVNAESNLTKDGTDVWVVENTAPQITDITTTSESRNGWYKTDITLTAAVTDQTSGLNNVKWSVDDGELKALMENPTSRQNRYEFSQSIAKHGVTKVAVYAEDNATNMAAEKEISIQIDKKAPQVKDVKGNPTEWQKEAAKLSFALADDGSGIDGSTIKVKNGDKEIELSSKDGRYYFTAAANGTFTVEALDKAGNRAEDGDIIVNKIQAEKPDKPNEDVIGGDITIGGEQGNTEGLPSEPDGWYTKDDVEIGLKNPENIPGQAQQKYHYKVWEKGQDPAEAEDVTFNEDNPVSIKKDGIWKVEIWIEDEAGNRSESIEKTIKIDSKAPKTTTEDKNLVVKNENSRTVSTELTDATSGVAPDKVTVTIGDTEVKPDIKEKDGKYICTFEVLDGGIYLLNSVDMAGNKAAYEITVTALKAQVNCTDGITGTTDRDKLLDAVDLSSYKNGETVVTSLNLKPQPEEQVPEETKSGITGLLKDGARLYYFSADISKSVLYHNVTIKDQISVTEKPVSITLRIPEAAIGMHQYQIIREHDGKYQIVQSQISEDGKEITFDTDRFSVYALSYTDGKEDQNAAPVTGDTSKTLLFSLCLAAAMAIILRISYIKCKRKY